MKTLYLIGGPMGVGKTTVARLLSRQLPRCAFLDGDWCWNIHPFTATDETKALVMDNIVHMLNGYLHCTAVDHVVFCWVMHQQSILDEITAHLDLHGVKVVPVSLLCSEEELRLRLQRDIDAGLRQGDVIPRALERLSHYASMRTCKLDTTVLTPEDTMHCIMDL